MSRFQEVKDKLRVVYKVTITKRDGEYRVNFINGKEATACYTNDLEDAFGTGVEMRNHQDWIDSLLPAERVLKGVEA